MKKTLVMLLAVSGTVLVSCTQSEYLGEVAQQGGNEIVFGGKTGRITRATQNTGTVAEMLDKQMKIYGVKNVGGTYADVFVNYKLWSQTSTTTSNPDGDWEYVGVAGTYGTVTLTADQTIKYWDYEATNYHFVAGSPVENFTYTLDGGDIKSATVTGIGGHINPNDGTPGTTTFSPVYIADPVNVPHDNFQQDVTFSFKRQQTFVRVGVFETIPGYSITAISFYPYETSGWGTTASSNIILASQTENYFQGTTTGSTATITYDWTTTPASYTFAYTAGTMTQQNNWYGGKFTFGSDDKLATTSTESTNLASLYGTDKDMAAATGYFTVIPSATDLVAQPILIKCDYTLTAEDGADVIHVKGATAAIPAAFCKWNPNTSYTYLFKISDNTNGTTGTVGTDPEGLFPITFDAVVEAEEDGTSLGNITSVTTPSITTYQEGSVTATGIKYVANKPIYFTAQNDETGATYNLTTGGDAVRNVQVYKLAAAASEADLILTRPTTTFTTTILATATKVGKWNVPAKSGSFTPDAAGYYAIEYQTAASPAAFAYKVVKVE